MPISHLFFADDSMVFCKFDETEARQVVKILEEYGNEFGQIVNLEKSSIFFGKGCSKKEKKCIVTSMNIQAKHGFNKYLGIQADFGHSKKAVFELVRRGIESRIDGWAEQFLSPARKSKAKGCHWLAWEKLTMRKKDKGLGFRDLIGFNLAMLAKVSWRVLHKSDSMIGVVLRDKYFPNSSFLEANKQNISSWGWKGILLGRQVLNCGLRWWVGDGESIRVASNPWIPKPDSFKSLMRFRAPNVKACCKALVMRHNLERRRIRVMNKCELCGLPDETKGHLFFGCKFSRAFWFGTAVQNDMAVELWRKQVDEFRESAMVEGMEHRDGRVLGRGSGCGWS
ncbi:hypothetical protein ACFX1Q_032619 [Malus domestica]